MKTNRILSENFSFELADILWKKNNKREGETKLSETIKFGQNLSECKFIVLGISEDIGPQMNNGLPGAKNGFQTFLSAFQNVQSNRFLEGSEIGFLGEITQKTEFSNHEMNKNWIEELDEFVYKVLNEFTHKEHILIVIGGGHNNAYPLFKHLKSNTTKNIHAMNIDPHADCRKTDFRHSGNPFSYAIEEGLLEKYSIIGLHESYNNEYIYNFLQKHEASQNYFEDYLNDPLIFWENVSSLANNSKDSFDYTLDLDIDSIAYAPSSAYTPSGFSIEECRRMVRILSSKIKFKHLHLPEGSPSSENDHKNYGKMITYLVIDFIKSQMNHYK